MGNNDAVTSPLISTTELRDRLEQVTLLDVRYRMDGKAAGPGAYAAGHLPGAVYVDLSTELAEAPGAGGRHPLPPTEVFEKAMRLAGVRGDTAVVVYDDWQGLAAGRCWWLLRYHGHPDVRILDGGYSAWLADGGAVEDGTATPAEGDFRAVPGGMAVVEADRVPDVGVLVDARAPERYRGETEPIDPVAGRIPGAVNVPTGRNLTEDGRFRTAEELRDIYAEVGAVPGADVAAYCGSGVTAIHDIVAMEIAGVRAALYPGSFSGWITDPARPVESG
jgi:thiosulfate/3-mercaptopyruvate sulfurtransferase